MTVSAFRTLAVLVFASTLAACGGGGAGGGGALPATPSSGNTTTTTITPAVSDANVMQLASSNGTISGTIRAGSRKAIVAVMSGAGDLGASSSPSFAQDSLAVNAAAITGTALSALRSPASAVQQPASPVEAFPADDARARRMVQSLTPAAGPAPLVRAKQSISGAAVGTAAPVWVEKAALGSSGSYQQVPATLEVQTAHGNIWIDNSLLSGGTASSSFAAGSLAATVAAIGSDFENAYASDTAHFAATQYSVDSPGLSPTYKACNADGSAAGTTKAYIAPPPDGRINVMVVNPRSFGTGMGGYFSSVNYMPQAALNCIGSSYRSNEAPFIYVGWFDNNGATYELKEDLVRGTAHELQHLINFVNHSLLASAGAYEETFINEGLSMLAQDLAVQHMYGSSSVQYDAADALRRAQAYLAAPQNFSVSGFIGIDAGSSAAQYNCGSGCYGSAYLFQRYLYDRLGGDAYAKAMETSSLVGASNISHAASGESFSQVLDDFGLALAASTAGVTPKDPRYAFGLNLTGSYADQIGGRTALTGVAALPMSGSAVQVQAPLGGFAFVNFGSVPASGQSFTITDRATIGGFAPVGGLVQQ